MDTAAAPTPAAQLPVSPAAGPDGLHAALPGPARRRNRFAAAHSARFLPAPARPRGQFC